MTTQDSSLILSGHGTHDASVLMLNDCTVLGASGFPCAPGESVSLAFHDRHVACSHMTYNVRFSMLELAELHITGPGAVTSGGGFIGGGFGIEDALQGIALAGVLNALTTRTKIHTFLTLTTNFGELHLHHGLMEPGPMRIFLSDVFARLRRLSPGWMQERGQVIDDQLANGLITPEEAEALWARLVAPPVWKEAKPGIAARDLIDQDAGIVVPKGRCPSCDKVIPLASDVCHYCNANFGPYASWKVMPLG